MGEKASADGASDCAEVMADGGLCSLDLVDSGQPGPPVKIAVERKYGFHRMPFHHRDVECISGAH